MLPFTKIGIYSTYRDHLQLLNIDIKTDWCEQFASFNIDSDQSIVENLSRISRSLAEYIDVQAIMLSIPNMNKLTLHEINRFKVRYELYASDNIIYVMYRYSDG